MENMKRTTDMTSGNILRIILVFALPLFLSSLFQTLYSSVDSLIVSKFIGNDAFSSITGLQSMINMFNSFFIGLSLGAGVVISRTFGEKDYEMMRKVIHTDIVLGMIAGIILTIIGLAAIPQIIRYLMNLDEAIRELSISYAFVYFSGGFFFVMYNIFNGILNAVGNSKRSLMYLIISSLTNIALDLLFVAVFKWGVASAALATIISQCLSAILAFIHLLRKDNIYHITIKELRIDKSLAKEILKYGIPTGIQNSVIGFANVLIQSNINSFGGEATAACGAFNKIESYVFLPITSYAMAIATFISQNLGASEFNRARIGARYGIILAIVMATLFGIMLFIFAPNFIKIFINNSDPNEAKTIINLATRQARTESLFFGFLACSHAMAAVFRGSGKAIVPMIVMLSVWCVFRSLYITIMMKIPATHDIIYIFMAYPITWTISTIIYTIMYFKGDWINAFKKQQIKIEKEAE